MFKKLSRIIDRYQDWVEGLDLVKSRFSGAAKDALLIFPFMVLILLLAIILLALT